MTAAAINSMFEKVNMGLSSSLEDKGYELVNLPSEEQDTHEGQLGGYLVANVPVNKAGDRVLMEMAVFELFDAKVLRYDTTIFTNITDAGVDSLTEVLEELNILCPFGHFCIYDGELYHRYSVILPEFTPSKSDKISESVLLDIETIRKIMAINFSSLEEALEDDDEYLRLKKKTGSKKK